MLSEVALNAIASRVCTKARAEERAPLLHTMHATAVMYHCLEA